MEKDLYKGVAMFVKSTFNCFAVGTTKGSHRGSHIRVTSRFLTNAFQLCMAADWGQATELIFVDEEQ